MQLVRPNVVAMAVKMEIIKLATIFQVLSLFSTDIVSWELEVSNKIW